MICFQFIFRQQGVELGKIGLLSLLGLCWTLKFIWAPLIDHTRRHRYWMASVDIGMGLVMMVFASQAGFGPWVWLAIGVFTALSATNDIAIDGYTIELLDKREMGLGQWHTHRLLPRRHVGRWRLIGLYRLHRAGPAPIFWLAAYSLHWLHAPCLRPPKVRAWQRKVMVA